MTKAISLEIHPSIVVDDLRVLRIIAGSLEIGALEVSVDADIPSIRILHVLFLSGRIGSRILDVNIDRLLRIEIDRCTKRNNSRILFVGIGCLGEVEKIHAEVDDLRVGLMDVSVKVQDEFVILVRKEEIATILKEIVGNLVTNLSIPCAHDVKPIRVFKTIRLIDPDSETTRQVGLLLVILLDVPLKYSVQASGSEQSDSTVVHVLLRGRIWTELYVIEPAKRIDARADLVSFKVFLDVLDIASEEKHAVCVKLNVFRLLLYLINKEVVCRDREIEISRRVVGLGHACIVNQGVPCKRIVKIVISVKQPICHGGYLLPF